MARPAGEFLDRPGLADVTLVGKDTGGAITQMLIRGAPRVGRVALASCEAFGNFPPGLTGTTLALAGKLPPTLFAGPAAALAPERQQAKPEVLRMARRLPPAHLAACGCTQINLIWIGTAAPVPKQDRRHNGGSSRACHPTADHVPRSAWVGRRPIKPQQLTARTGARLPLGAPEHHGAT